MRSEQTTVGICILCLCLAAIVGAIIGANQTGFIEGCKKMQQEAIEHGYAEYDAKTGEWKWKGDGSK